MRINKNFYFMCKHSKELQESRKMLFEDGDYFISREEVDLTKDFFNCKLASSCRCLDTPMNNGVRVWIPTINQLIELLKKKYPDKFTLEFEVIENIFKEANAIYKAYVTVQEMFLDHYLSDKYSWNFENLSWKLKAV